VAEARVPFFKYTANGNNFLIVDETRRPLLQESEKSAFAVLATNLHFGVGADGVIFLQPSQPSVLGEINAVRKYWKVRPSYSAAQWLFRIFEPNGSESFSCGNGLMCVANYLNARYGIGSARILTQLPGQKPISVTIGRGSWPGAYWAAMGKPRRVPKAIADPSHLRPLLADVDAVEDLQITFRAHDLHPFSDQTALTLKGYLVYTGEPHLVVFVHDGLSIAALGKLLFGSPEASLRIEGKVERRIVIGSWLIHHIGAHLNKNYRSVFPYGINVDFVQIPDRADTIEYRCFERGINKETLACGTGALAVAVVCRQLNLVKAPKVAVWPSRCRWHYPEAAIIVEEARSKWKITSCPRALIAGVFQLEDLRRRELHRWEDRFSELAMEAAADPALATDGEAEPDRSPLELEPSPCSVASELA
jgi:diaminopimelate epimerase